MLLYLTYHNNVFFHGIEVTGLQLNGKSSYNPHIFLSAMRKNWEAYWFFSLCMSITPKGINEEGNVCNNGQIGILVAITTPCLCSLMLFLMSPLIKRDCCVVGTQLMWQNIAAFQFNVFITRSWRKCALLSLREDLFHEDEQTIKIN